MVGKMQDARLDAINRRFDRLEALITEQGAELRHHMDLFAERFRADLKLISEKYHTPLEDRGRSTQPLEKRRR